MRPSLQQPGTSGSGGEIGAGGPGAADHKAPQAWHKGRPRTGAPPGVIYVSQIFLKIYPSPRKWVRLLTLPERFGVEIRTVEEAGQWTGPRGKQKQIADGRTCCTLESQAVQVAFVDSRLPLAWPPSVPSLPGLA
jgi:hypothetical protein